MRKMIVLAAAAASAAVVAACGPSHHSTSTTTPHASLTTRVQCGAQMAQWEKSSHFSSLLKQLATDIRTVPLGNAAGDRTAMQQVTHGLVSDVMFLQAHPTPNCVPGFDTQLNAGLSALLAADAASHSKSSTSVKVASGDLHTAGKDLRAAAADAAHYARTGQ